MPPHAWPATPHAWQADPFTPHPRAPRGRPPPPCPPAPPPAALAVSGVVRVDVSQLDASASAFNGRASWVVEGFGDKADVVSALTATDYIPCFSGAARAPAGWRNLACDAVKAAARGRLRSQVRVRSCSLWASVHAAHRACACPFGLVAWPTNPPLFQAKSPPPKNTAPLRRRPPPSN